MSLRYIIDSFKTKQVLDKSYQRYVKPFETDKWWGEYDREYDQNLVIQVLNAFDKNREEHFELIHQSDYRDTYRSKNLPIGIYLKHYRVFDAKYSRTTIVRRNIIRRTLAKKSFALTYRLRKLGIPSIESLFYAGSRGEYICKEALYASIALPGSVTLDYFLQTFSSTEGRGSYTMQYLPSLPEIDMANLLWTFGAFCKVLIDTGVHLVPRELIANLLLYKEGDTCRFALCDTDTIGAISPISPSQQRIILRHIGRELEQRLQTLRMKSESKAFFEGAALL